MELLRDGFGNLPKNLLALYLLLSDVKTDAL